MAVTFYFELAKPGIMENKLKNQRSSASNNYFFSISKTSSVTLTLENKFHRQISANLNGHGDIQMIL